MLACDEAARSHVRSAAPWGVFTRVEKGKLPGILPAQPSHLRRMATSCRRASSLRPSMFWPASRPGPDPECLHSLTHGNAAGYLELPAAEAGNQVRLMTSPSMARTAYVHRGHDREAEARGS